MSGVEPSVLLERREQSVLWLTLDRPEKRNALNAPLVAALRGALTRAAADDTVRAVALQGAGKDFCAGADLAEIEQAASAPVAANLADAEGLGALLLLLRRIERPVVAVVRGRALAGGFGLAAACDLVIAEESARFGFPEVGIGFVPALVLAVLTRNLGEKRAFELACLGESIAAREAERLGLVNRCVADGTLEESAHEVLGRLASRSPSAMRLTKRLLYRQDALSFETAIHAGARVNTLARLTEDARRGIAGFTGGRG